jgi:hypothetical protein
LEWSQAAAQFFTLCVIEAERGRMGQNNLGWQHLVQQTAARLSLGEAPEH